jgi:CubicO group peptidase (beta-lactamase class C family)
MLKNYLKTGVLAVILAAYSFYSGAQQITRLDGSFLSSSKADSIIRKLMHDGKVMGLCISVLNDNRPVYTRAFGLKNNQTKEALDTATVLYGASLSKAVFAFLVMQLVQQRVIDLDKPIYKYLDKPLTDYDKYKDLAGDERWKQITARMCLSHTTGFPNWRFFKPYTGAYDQKGKLAIYFTPGSRYAYSGEGMVLLQMVIEKITGRDIQQLAVEKIFTPAGMTRTGFTWQPAFDDDYAAGHDENGAVLFKDKKSAPNAAGSMVTTIADYSRFIAYVMQGKGLNKKTKALMLSPQIKINSKYGFPTLSHDTTDENNAIQLAYGLGWGVFKCKYGKAFTKGGHDDGWRHYNVNFPDKKISIIILTNSANGEGIFKDLLEKIIGDTYTPWRWERYIPYNGAIK